MDDGIGLAGHVALVTGGTSGIGLACALALGRAGAAVVVNHRPGHDEKGRGVVERIADAGGRAIHVGADVRDEDQVRAMFAEAVEAFGTVHVLVNNAGIQRDSPFDEMSLDAWREVVDVNLTGQFLCAREAVREFLRRGPQPEVSSATGKIVAMSSVHEIIPWACRVNYAASKGGVALLCRSLAQEYARRKIRVNAVAPGAIRTPINREAWEDPAARRELLKLIPYDRIGEPEEVADAVVWLASDASDYVTGATLLVDGGMTLYPAFYGGG